MPSDAECQFRRMGDLKGNDGHTHGADLECELRRRYRFEAIVGHNPKIVQLLKRVSQVAETDVTVLIQAECGTGKELVARAVYYNGRRKHKPFIPINCGALAENLLESELFGHVRGAFTGASRDMPGWFARADGGTIFLDEVSEMSPALQVKLLRVLQTGEYAPIGGAKNHRCDVRIISATNKNLHKLIEAGRFRQDLYFRLDVVDITIPPLRDRKDDLPVLSKHFMKLFGAKYGKENLRLSQEAEIWLLAYDFPGNVRELENIIQRAVVLIEGEVIEHHHLPPGVYQPGNGASGNGRPSTFKVAKERVVEKFERGFIVDCLKATRGNVSRASQVAGLNVKNFHAKISKYEIDHRDYKVVAE